MRKLIDVKTLKQDLMMYGLIVFADMDVVTKAMKIVNRQIEIDAIPVDWIEERIRNAKCAGNSLIAQMWQELIDGYRREHGNG